MKEMDDCVAAFERIVDEYYERCSPVDRLIMDAVRDVEHPANDLSANGVRVRCQMAAREARASLIISEEFVS